MHNWAIFSDPDEGGLMVQEGSGEPALSDIVSSTCWLHPLANDQHLGHSSPLVLSGAVAAENRGIPGSPSLPAQHRALCTESVSRAGHKLMLLLWQIVKSFHSHTHSHTLASGSYTDSFGFSSWWVKGQEIKTVPVHSIWDSLLAWSFFQYCTLVNNYSFGSYF